MKFKIVFSCLFLGVVGVHAQTSHGSATSVLETRWDLDRYVWSHTHGGLLSGNKRLLDFDALDNWQMYDASLTGITVSPNGEYIGYTIVRAANIYKVDSQVVQSTSGSWRLALTGIIGLGFFSGDSRQYIFKDKEGWCFLKVGTGERQYVKGVASYKLPGVNSGLENNKGKNEWMALGLASPKGNVLLRNLLTDKEKVFEHVLEYSFDATDHWLVCELEGASKELLVYNLVSGEERRFSQTMGYMFSHNGHVLLIKTAESSTSGTMARVEYVDLETGKIETIWRSQDTTTNINSMGLDGPGKQAVLLLKNKNKERSSLWYWQMGMAQAEEKVNDGEVSDLQLQGPVSFTDNDRYIQLSLRPFPDDQKPSPGWVQVDVWSYRDSALQSIQQGESKKQASYKVIFNPHNSQWIQIENNKYERSSLLVSDYAVVTKSGERVYRDQFWKRGYDKDSTWLVSLEDGGRRLLPTCCRRENIWFSPDGRYIVYFDVERGGNYYSYEVKSGHEINISEGVPAWWLGFRDSYLHTPDKPKKAIGMAAWLAGYNKVLVYDDYDIWSLDLSGKEKPRNITNGYGRKHQLLFSLLNGDRLGLGGGVSKNPFIDSNVLMLRAFSRKTKYNGYYRKQWSRVGDPEQLFMGPYFFEVVANTNRITDGMSPLKALDVHSWIVQRQSVSDAPNYYLTEDFKSFKQLTFQEQHKGYNWVKTELHRFKQVDGTMSQGILYKPENFDAGKKYPVIIAFYGQLTDRLYQYPIPEYIDAPHIQENPAWMVSHGYLVFMPDIYFTKDKYGPSVLNTVEGAVNYVSSLPYVDAKHIGSTSHSNGGRFGYYVFTHTNKLAAMSIGSGMGGTDIISVTLTEDDGLMWGENSAYGAGLGNIWQNKERWVDHIAVLQADKAANPLLLFHNKKDGDDVRLAKELYIALRRLEKPVWWLQYDSGYHTVGGNDARDFTIRLTQYFDHYLKSAPAPLWMTQGVPYRLKGIESGYELDKAGHCGPSCPVCHQRTKTK